MVEAAIEPPASADVCCWPTFSVIVPDSLNVAENVPPFRRISMGGVVDKLPARRTAKVKLPSSK